MLSRWSLPGLAHVAIFLGFLVFLPRTFLLFGRAFDPDFGQFVAGDDLVPFTMLRLGYAWLKDTTAVVVVLGVAVFAALRWRRFEARLEPKLSALCILAAIAVMMLADLFYDASGIALAGLGSGLCGTAAAAQASVAVSFVTPFCQTDLHRLDPIMSTLLAVLPANSAALLAIGLVSYGFHVVLVGAFLVSLPHSKHFHLITIWPKLFLSDFSRGALSFVATSEQALCELVEASLEPVSELALSEAVEASSAPGAGLDASSANAVRRSPIGKESLADFSFAERLDLFACTQCGRCTASCPAANTGKLLDPRRINQKLRKHLQKAPVGGTALKQHLFTPIVPEILEAEAVWACTNCGACEQACPVGVRFVAPIVDLRRNLLLMRAEAPVELQRGFNATEKNGNPYGFPHAERATWAQGLGVPLLKDVTSVEYLFWVGCAACYDDRAKSIARAMVRLMQRAGVSFAILGLEERCTGEAARRAGNELLFLQLAEHNIALLNRYQAEGRFQRIITACPHCLMTLAQQYPALGGVFDVTSHVEAIARWIDQGKLVLASGESALAEAPDPKETITYHDPCNLARGAGVIDEPRRALRSMSGVRLIEPRQSREQGTCCGAGGSQLWLEERGHARMNERRVAELSSTRARHVVTACPFCLTMLNEGAKTTPGSEAMRVTDLAELVESRLQRRGDRSRPDAQSSQ